MFVWHDFTKKWIMKSSRWRRESSPDFHKQISLSVIVDLPLTWIFLRVVLAESAGIQKEEREREANISQVTKK